VQLALLEAAVDPDLEALDRLLKTIDA
jgi:hypothetical protein